MENEKGIPKTVKLDGIVVGEYISTGNFEYDAELAKNVLKEKGLYREPNLVESMFSSANSFAHVAIELYESGLRASPFEVRKVSPFIVNGTFAIELYFKTIHVAIGRPQRGHELIKLYDSLDGEAKRVIGLCSVELKDFYKIDDAWEIQDCLGAINKAFEEWRYIFEHTRKSIEIQPMRYAMHVVGESCNRIVHSKK